MGELIQFPSKGPTQKETVQVDLLTCPQCSAILAAARMDSQSIAICVFCTGILSPGPNDGGGDHEPAA